MKEVDKLLEVKSMGGSLSGMVVKRGTGKESKQKIESMYQFYEPE